MITQSNPYPARLDIDYPERLDRLTTFFRLIWALPIVIVLSLLTGAGNETVVTQSGEQIRSSGGGIVGGFFVATMLMILFRQRYPRWWFDFALELNRFSTRVGAYLGLLTDRYPSTEEHQSVHLEIDYPDVERDLNRWLPLVKWLLAIPHYVVLVVLVGIAIVAIVIAWFAILFTGRYPRGLFDYVVGVGRWGLRVQAYASLLVTDRYPPFSLKQSEYFIEARSGGAYEIQSAAAGTGVRGELLSLDAGKEIGLTWKWMNHGVSEVAEQVWVRFTPIDGGTLVAVTHHLDEAAGEGDDIRQGWSDVLGRLAAVASRVT